MSGILIFTFGLAMIATSLSARGGQTRAAITFAQAGPWQAWPCRLERIHGNTVTRRVLLLAPDGSTCRELWANVPECLWLDRTDGPGLLWFCGDLRFGGLFAEPGGAPVWQAKPPEPGEERGGHGSGNDGSLVADLAREAGRTAFGNLLG